MAFQRHPTFQLPGYQQQAGAAGPAVVSVVLFPEEGLRFRNRLDKTLYALAVYARDARGAARRAAPRYDYIVKQNIVTPYAYA